MESRGRLNTTILILCVAAGVLPFLAFGANEPFDIKGDASNYARAMGQAESVEWIVPTAQAGCVPRDTGGTTCGVYGWDSVSMVDLKAIAACSWTQDLTTDLGAVSDTAVGALQITIGTATGDGAGHQFDARDVFDFMPMQGALKGRLGYVGRYCDTPVRGHGGNPVYPPCTGDADCVAQVGAGATCGAANANELRGGAYLFCRAAAANTKLISTAVR